MLTKTFLYLFLIFSLPRQLHAQTDTSHVNELNNKAWVLRSSNLDSSILLSESALRILTETKYPSFATNWQKKTLAKTQFYLGSFYRDVGKTGLSLEYLGKSMKAAENTGDHTLRCQALNAIGLVYYTQGRFPTALDFYLKGLQIAEEKGLKKNISVLLANMGNVYDAEKNFPKALEYYGRALKIAEEASDQHRIAVQLGNIGMVYNEQNILDKALVFYDSSLVLYKTIDDKEGISIILNNLASLYQAQGDYLRSLDYYKQSLRQTEEQGDVDHICSRIGNMGILYMLMKDYKMAEQLLLKSVRMAEENHSFESLKEFEGALSELYSLQGKHESALTHYKKHISIKDSLFNAENIEKNLILEMNYDFEKKKAIDKAVHAKQVLLLKAENKAQEQFRFFLFAVLGLAIILLFIARRAYIIKKQNAEFLAGESQRKEVLLQEVHHRVNNNLQIISSLLDLQASSAEDERLNEYLRQSQNRIQSLSVLHELLYQDQSAIEINMHDYLNKILQFHRDILTSKNPNAIIEMNVAQVAFPTKTAVPLALIVNELVTNSIKYAFDGDTNPLIGISLQSDASKKNKWVLKVNDNGKGLPADPEVKRESLGLRLVAILARQIHADFTQSNLQGTMFTFRFSLHINKIKNEAGD